MDLQSGKAGGSGEFFQYTCPGDPTPNDSSHQDQGGYDVYTGFCRLNQGLSSDYSVTATFG